MFRILWLNGPRPQARLYRLLLRVNAQKRAIMRVTHTQERRPHPVGPHPGKPRRSCSASPELATTLVKPAARRDQEEKATVALKSPRRLPFPSPLFTPTSPPPPPLPLLLHHRRPPSQGRSRRLPRRARGERDRSPAAAAVCSVTGGAAI
jgi:hypothetical protein